MDSEKQESEAGSHASEGGEGPSGYSRKTWIIVAAAIGLVVFICASQITFFVIQPIGAIPEGRTLVILRLEDGRLVDSADAMCERKMGGVSLLCRLAVLGAVAEKSNILLRLPYSKSLYLWSTGGAEYDR